MAQLVFFPGWEMSAWTQSPTFPPPHAGLSFRGLQCNFPRMNSVTGSMTYSLLTAFLQVAYGNTKCHKTVLSQTAADVCVSWFLPSTDCRWPDSCHSAKNIQLTCTTQTYYVFIACERSNYTWKCVRVCFNTKKWEWICIIVTASYCFASQKHAQLALAPTGCYICRIS